jgi:uncharacterized protein (TIGR00162 family)
MQEGTWVVEKEKYKLKNGILITGLPGIGLVGQVVGRYLVEQLKAKKIANLYSHHFPHQVFMTKKGGLRLIKNSIYAYKSRNVHLLILIGDVQAMSSVGQYEVSNFILDYARKVGVTQIITVGGYSTGKLSDVRSVHAVSTNEKLRTKLRKHGVLFGKAKGSIVGAAGLLPSLGRLKGIEGFCLMGETHGGFVDTKAAKEVVAVLAKYLGLKMNLEELENRAKESEKVLKTMEEEIQKNMVSPYEPGKHGVSYIR